MPPAVFVQLPWKGRNLVKVGLVNVEDVGDLGDAVRSEFELSVQELVNLDLRLVCHSGEVLQEQQVDEAFQRASSLLEHPAQSLEDAGITDRCYLIGKLRPQASTGAEQTAGHPWVGPEEVEEACFRAIIRSKALESKALSEISYTEWKNISSAYGLTCESVMPLLPDQSSEAIAVFAWSDENENQQSERYMLHLRSLIPMSNRTSYPLAWLEGGDRGSGLLTSASHTGSLHFGQISGSADVAIVTRASLLTLMPATGLCILFELKEQVDTKAMAQGMCKLLLANLHSPNWRPVVVVTDLKDVWNLLYIDSSTLRASSCSRGAAVIIIRALVEAAAVQAVGEPRHETAPAVPGDCVSPASANPQ